MGCFDDLDDLKEGMMGSKDWELRSEYSCFVPVNLFDRRASI